MLNLVTFAGRDAQNHSTWKGHCENAGTNRNVDDHVRGRVMHNDEVVVGRVFPSVMSPMISIH